MQFSDLIAELKDSKYLFLEEVVEPLTNSLRLAIREGHVSDRAVTFEVGGKPFDGKPIEVTAQSRTFEMEWRTYVAYTVTNESFGKPSEAGEVWEGHCVRLYSASQFLDYVRRTTLACDEYPGKLRHFSLICQDHLVDVVSTEEPTIFESTAPSIER